MQLRTIQRRASTATGATIDYQYDTLRRLTRSKVALNGSTVYTTAYAFRDLDASRTTTQVQYRNVRNANGEVLEGKKYTYDALGNITRISQSTGHFYPLVAYEYDAQNQLTKETYYNGEGSAAGNITRTISYTYDTAGNILSETRTEDGETTTKTYGYGDSEWADLLTEVDGQAITYDASGNPTSYFGRTMTWTNGRQLKTSTTHALGSVLKSTYTYDADGIRKTKTVPINRRGLTCTYTFVTQNGKVVRQSWRTESIDFFYDESGRPFAMTYQRANDAPQTYYYVLNLQGDVVKLVDASGAEVASYEYDAWGNILSQSGGMASANPLRYRGYYYDTETGFYYLQSRYYDPATRRFINADVYSSTDSSDAVSCNMFAYCGNNPVFREDANGGFWLTAGIMAVGGLIGAAVSAVSSVVTQKALTGTVNWKSVGVAAASGFVSGAVAASPLGLAGQMVAGGVISGLSYAADCYVNDKAMKLDEAVISVGMGVVAGRIGGAGANEEMVLTNAANSAKQAIARETRRANQDYAQKAIAAAISSRNNTFATTAWASSARFAVGTGFSNGVNAFWSKRGLFPDAPTWKPW